MLRVHWELSGSLLESFNGSLKGSAETLSERTRSVLLFSHAQRDRTTQQDPTAGPLGDNATDTGLIFVKY